MEEARPKRSRWVTVMLVALPLWLLVSAVFGVWWSFQLQEKKDREKANRFSRLVSRKEIEGDLRILLDTIGERHALRGIGLTRTAAWIDGSLGPSNAGYDMKRVAGPDTGMGSWPVEHAVLLGNHKAPGVWVVAAYDSPGGSKGGERNASGVVALMAVAQTMATETPGRPVHFVFVPHGSDPAAPVAEMAGVVRRMIHDEGGASAVLCVEAMGLGQDLRVTPFNASNPAAGVLGELGGVVPADGKETGLAAELAKLGMPALAVSSSGSLPSPEDDSAGPDASRVAASSGCLVEWIRRISSLR